MPKKTDLCLYRFNSAIETLDTAKMCMDNKKYKDAINRCYYSAFYAVKAVLALEEVDFKRHKDIVAYFNQHYVATDLFPRDIGRMMGRLQKKRESSDYDDFYLASLDEVKEQYTFAEMIIMEVEKYICRNDSVEKDLKK